MSSAHLVTFPKIQADSCWKPCSAWVETLITLNRVYIYIYNNLCDLNLGSLEFYFTIVPQSSSYFDQIMHTENGCLCVLETDIWEEGKWREEEERVVDPRTLYRKKHHLSLRKETHKVVLHRLHNPRLSWVPLAKFPVTRPLTEACRVEGHAFPQLHRTLQVE